MRIRKVIQRRIRHSGEGVDFVGDVNAAISANVGERSQTTHVHSQNTAVSRQEGRAEDRQNEQSDD